MPVHFSDAADALARLPEDLREDVILTRTVAECFGCDPGAAMAAAATLVVAHRAQADE